MLAVEAFRERKGSGIVSVLRFLGLTWIGRALIGLILIAVVGGAVVAPRLTPAQPQTTTRTATVTRGNILQTVAVSGSVNAAAQVRAAFKPTGRISEILVKVGDAVTAGQPLAKLDPTDLRSAVRQAEASLLSAQARYDSTIAGASAEDIALAKNAVDSAQLSYDQSKKTTATDVVTAQQALDKAKRSLADAKVTTANDVATAQQALDKAMRSLADAKVTTANDVATAQQALDRAKAALATAQKSAQSDNASALQTWTKVQTSYAAAKSNLATQTSGIATDLASYTDGIATARAQLQTAQTDLDAISRTSNTSSARGSLSSAESALANADTYAKGVLKAALDDHRAARDALTAVVSVFDGVVASGKDTATTVSQYQSAFATYTLAATKLSNAIDSTAGQVSSAQTSVAAALSALTGVVSTVSTAWTDVTALQSTLNSEAQLSSGAKSRITQAATSLTTITDDVSGAYLSAQDAYTSALAKSDSSVQTARDAVTSAEQALTAAQLKAQTSVQTARDAVTSAEQALTAAQLKAQTSVQTAQDAVTSAELSLATAQDKVTSTVAAQEIALRNAQVNYEKAVASPKAADIASALSSLQLAQISLDKANNDLDGATLRSPVAGVVASVANQIGEAPASPFAVVAVTSTVVLHGTIGEADVAKLKTGQAATVVVDAVGSTTRLTGKVTALDPVATIQSGVPVYGVDVTIDRPDPAVRPGMSGTATVIVANKQGVLTVPNLAIRTSGGQRVVQVMRDSAATDAQVTFGISNDTTTEVTSGLQEGDVVVLPAARTATATARPQQFGPGGAAGPGVIVR